jgi:polyketide biosynthesis enoyl-CoA hydratase PksH
MHGVKMGFDTLDVSSFGPAMQISLRKSTLCRLMLDELLVVVGRARSEGHSGLLLSAGGEDFCLGMDFASAVSSLQTTNEKPTPHLFSKLLDQLQQYPGLVIGLVNGSALGGGCALAASCDVVVAGTDARFGLPEALWGLEPAVAAPSIVHRVGVAVARRMALETDSINAQTALRLGLVDHLATDAMNAEGTARKLFLRAHRAGSHSLSNIKSLFARLDAEPETYPQWANQRTVQLISQPHVQTRLGIIQNDEVKK